MSFIGVVSDSKCFDIIKEKIKENDKENQFNFRLYLCLFRCKIYI